MKKVCSIILAVMMVVSMIPVWTIAVSAEDHVHVDADKDNLCDSCKNELYVVRSWDATNKKVVETLTAIPAIPGDAVKLESSDTAVTLEAGTTYVVDGTVTCAEAITVSGTAASPTHLILKDGASLTAKNGIRVNNGYEIRIYGQPNDSGILIATNASRASGIGGWGTKTKSGNVIIHGGTINATGFNRGAGIGGYIGAESGNTVIYGGKVTATGDQESPGICTTGGSCTIYGGIVVATANASGAGIGTSGSSSKAGGPVTIFGGNVTATSAGGSLIDAGAGIGGGGYTAGVDFTMSGGTLTAIGGVDTTFNDIAAGIGANNTKNGGEFKYSQGSFTIPGTPVIKSGASAEDAKATTVDDYAANRDRYVYIHYHEFTASYVDNEDGTHSAKCACGEVSTVKTGHIFEDDKCTVCGAEKPTHEHVFSTEWTTDKTAHWHACTAADCDIEDYATCGLEGAAYATHTWENGKCKVCDADEPVPTGNIGLLTENALTKNTATVYFGTYSGDYATETDYIKGTPVAFRVLKDMENGTLRMISNGPLSEKIAFDATNNSNEYSTSYLKKVVDTAVSLSNGELNAIKERCLPGGQVFVWYNDGVAGESVTAKLWAPTMNDISNLILVSGLGISDYWSCSPADGTDFAILANKGAFIMLQGHKGISVKMVYGKSRAGFDLDLSKVVLALPVSGEENTYTLTVMGEEYNSFSVENCENTESGKVKITFTGAVKGDDKYISYYTLDKDANITSYVKIPTSTIEDNFIEIEKPILADGEKLYLINEQITEGEKSTNYSSMPNLVNLPHVHEYDATGTCVCGEKVTVLYKNYLVEGHEPVANGASGLYNRYSYYLDKDGKEVVLNEKLYNEDKSVTFEQWYLRTMIQYKAGEDGALDIRFASMLDENLDQYKEAGFIVEVDGQATPITLKTTEAVQSFVADDKTYTIGDFSEANDYFFLQNTVFAASLVEGKADVKVTPFVTLMDGKTTLKGAEVTFNLGTIADIAGIQFKPN